MYDVDVWSGKRRVTELRCQLVEMEKLLAPATLRIPRFL